MSNMQIRNILIYLAALLHQSSAIQHSVVWSAKKGYRLNGSVFRSLQLASSLECGQHCVIDQQCLSVNYMSTEAPYMQSSLCELNYATTCGHEGNLKEDPDFTYYEPIIRKPPNPTSPVVERARCSDLLSRNSASGFYEIWNTTSTKSIKIFCHVDGVLNKSWTLVLASEYKHWETTSKKAFWEDQPLNNTIPNFISYRMSLSQMQEIRAQSTMWRAGCNYQGAIADTLDTVRGKFGEIDLFKAETVEGCRKLEYINVRGFDCKNCTALWYQSSAMFPHADSGRQSNCTFDARSGSVVSEDNFGFYVNINAQFGCTKHNNSTTSWWFG